MKSTYYITTPIYYVNDLPHIGHAYTTLACDVIARFKRLDEYEVFFLTGTDEHGQKVETAAKNNGVKPKEFVDNVSENFRKLANCMNFSNDSFIRTTEQKHIKSCQKIWEKLLSNGNIYLDKYSGWYAVRDEAFFSESEIVDGKNPNSKVINYQLTEKATGELTAGAGVGTDGGSFFFGIRENNYLGKGVAVDANINVSTDSIKGNYSITNPNFKNSDKSIYLNIKAEETDKLSGYGYKTNKTGLALGTSFEYLKDFNLGLSVSSFFENMETDSTASARQKKQAGNYFDTFLKFNFDYDKRNQKFKTSDGFRSNYSINVPIISDTNSLTNRYNYTIFNEFFENNITTFALSLASANSVSNDDVKLSERLFIPSRRLRGFESGKIGPKDGNDFIGGNYSATFNAQTNIPKIFQNFQNLDAVMFFDAGSLWGVDYDSSLDDGGKLRSSIGVGVDWFTVIGPLNFTLSEVITKEDNDITEGFRFNLGTTF